MKKNEITFRVDGLRIAGEVYFPDTSVQPSPGLCICHGIPAVAHNPADRGYAMLAERFCELGFVTLIFNFRGAGQSEGNLEMRGWTRDLEAAIDLMCGLDEVNRSRLHILGSSGGAAVSVYVAAHDQRVSSVATFACPADFGFLTNEQQTGAVIDHMRSIGLIRDSDFPRSVDEWRQGFKTISPVEWIDGISPRPLFLIHGDKDDVVDVEHAFRLYQRAGEPRDIALIPGAGHRLRLDERAIAIAQGWLLNLASG